MRPVGYPKRSRLSRLVRFIGGIRFAVPVLMLVALALAWGTWIESTSNADEAGRLVYGSWWFITLMVLVCASLVISVLLRWPWRRKHVGFIVVHASLVLLIASSFLSFFTRIEGQIQLAEGERANELQTNARQIEMLRHENGQFFHVGAAPLAPFAQVRINGLSLRVTEQWANTAEEFAVTNDGINPLHAVEVMAASGETYWIGQSQPGSEPEFMEGVFVRVLPEGVTHESPEFHDGHAHFPLVFFELIDGSPSIVVFGDETSNERIEHDGEWPWHIDSQLAGALHVMRQLDHARGSNTLIEAPESENNRPALVVEYEDHGHTQRVVLPWGQGVPVQVGDDVRILRYAPVLRPLPFGIELADFRKIDYPGTDNAMAYESDVVFSIDDTQTETTIWMNHPLEHEGWKVYQAGFVGDAISVFQVTRDPGLTPTYIACVTLCVGIVVTFYSRSLSRGHPGIPAPFSETSKQIGENHASVDDRPHRDTRVVAGVTGTESGQPAHTQEPAHTAPGTRHAPGHARAKGRGAADRTHELV
ncbi:MAG: cytochrome c biogenesis protein ResB [Phycisphaerales bacterium JB043]